MLAMVFNTIPSGIVTTKNQASHSGKTIVIIGLRLHLGRATRQRRCKHCMSSAWEPRSNRYLRPENIRTRPLFSLHRRIPNIQPNPNLVRYLRQSFGCILACFGFPQHGQTSRTGNSFFAVFMLTFEPFLRRETVALLTPVNFSTCRTLSLSVIFIPFWHLPPNFTVNHSARAFLADAK